MNKALTLKIGIIGDFEPGRPSHKATNDALKHSADYLQLNCEIEWIPTDKLADDAVRSLSPYDGLWCAPGSPYKSMSGALNGIRFARENNIPFIGTCGGFQHAALEYAKNKLGINIIGDKDSDPYESNLFISQLSCSLIGETKEIYICKDTFVFNIYKETKITERYNCSFGLKSDFQELLSGNGMQIAGMDGNKEARILEIPQNRFYVATLFQPQLSSTPSNPHKLINAFLYGASGL